MGMSTLERRLACMAESRSSWLRRLNSAVEASSWQKTFTTFSPEIVSSTKPLTAPRRCCWAAKCLAEAPPILPVTRVIRPTMARVRMVKGTESTIIETNVITIVTEEFTNWGMVWEISWRRVSTSLVYRLMMSPWEWESK